MSSVGYKNESETRRRRAGWCACALLVLVLPCWLLPMRAEADQQAATEASVKSAFLYKFTHFADWPPETMGEAGDPFAMCVMGRDELAAVLEHAVAGRSARNRPLLVRRIERVEESQGCHLLFIGSLTQDKVERILGALGPQPTLTVSDVKGFARRGGMINLTKEGKRLRFEINRRAAEQAGIHLSSQLLKLADLVGDNGEEE